jgi:para-nitrobenzyl esterase
MLNVIERTSVRTGRGTVRGTIEDGVHVFRGIPYAQPPFGPNRLRPPRPAEPWTGERDATHDGPIPIQLTAADGPAAAFIPPGPAPGEDCLNLNIWTPSLGAAGLPVIVWITGGSFQFGAAGWYDGSRFARDGVVLVSINYRPGAEGFLQLRDAVPNRGLLDQVAALQWIHEEAARFGGDPDLVTVCGESAGAMSIGALLAMPAARGLFRRAILQSGAAHHVLPDMTALRIGAALAGVLGVEPTLDAVSAVPPERVLGAHEQLRAELLAHPDPSRWSADVVASCMLMQPVVDGDVIPAAPVDRIQAGSAADVDVLIGTNEDDWRLFLAASGGIAQVTDASLAGPVASFGSMSAEAYGMPVERGLADYRERLPSASPGELLAAIQTDWWCRIPALRLADAHTGAGTPAAARTFMYEFAWPSPVAGGSFGACHALEIPFVFDTLDEGAGQMLGVLLGDEPPQALATRMHRAWVSFAATGDPGWPAYDLEQRRTMRFGVTSTVVDDPRAWERRVWAGRR